MAGSAVSALAIDGRTYHPVANGDEVTSAPLGVSLGGRRYVVWRDSADDRVVAAVDECPHRGARLSQGWLADGCLVCPYHGWRFGSDGGCRLIPQNDDDLPIPRRARLLGVQVHEHDGRIWLCADSG